MNDDDIKQWFAGLQRELETAYLAAETAWQQSGFSGPIERWVACRRVIADCMKESGTFLDIGCANGYLLECVLGWAGERGVEIDPWGLDLSERLVGWAKERLGNHKEKLFVGNGLFWEPPRLFDYVRTELCYVPNECVHSYIERILNEYLTPGGKLLVAEYRSRGQSSSGPWVDDNLRELGFAVESCVGGFWQSQELTRVAMVCSSKIG
ncbi:MAG: methyltransferase domain-containing protein [Sedimentisphaerales bacterium]|nr:methyltransferase domain-containing protein [Sedimentisphaerales bacterium]